MSNTSTIEQSLIASQPVAALATAPNKHS